jgi:hypothetical protein
LYSKTDVKKICRRVHAAGILQEQNRGAHD